MQQSQHFHSNTTELGERNMEDALDRLIAELSMEISDLSATYQNGIHAKVREWDRGYMSGRLSGLRDTHAELCKLRVRT